MTSSSFNSMFCDGSSDTHSCLLASKLWSLRFPCFEILAAKVEGKPGVTDNYCWTTDHEHREHSLRVPCRLQWDVSSAIWEWTWPEKVKQSRCRIDLFSNCSVFPLILSDQGTNPSLGTNPPLDDTFCLQWYVFMSVWSHLFYKEPAATPHRAEQVRSGTKWVVQGGVGTMSGLCFWLCSSFTDWPWADL